MASTWTQKIERVACSACGWKATRARPKLCPACRAETVVVTDRKHSWKASHRDPTGRVRSRNFAKKEDAGAWLGTVAVSVREHTYRDPSRGKELLADLVR